MVNFLGDVLDYRFVNATQVTLCKSNEWEIGDNNNNKLN